MARTSGFAINRHIHNFLRILGVDFATAGITEAQAIHEIRAMTGKYQPEDAIEMDLIEITAQEQAMTQGAQPQAEEE